jgi:hypothetical protein
MADIVHSIEVAAAPEAIYPLVSTGPGFRAWWAEDVVVTSDGRVELGLFGRATVYHMHATSQKPGRSRMANWRAARVGRHWAGFSSSSREGRDTRSLRARGLAAAPYFVSCNTTWGG